MGIIQLESVEHGIDLVRSEVMTQPVGAQTKNCLVSADDQVQLLDCRQICGITEYEPTEFTFTAKPGTPISEIQKSLDANGQYLPFDPPFAKRGSTLAGAIAAGINGSSSLRFGGIRDFVIGIKYIDGLGNEISSGGKVVKNAAGFDMSKFMVGSYGQFGVLTEVALKVFPRPETFSTLEYSADLTNALERIKKLILTPLEIDALDWMDGKLWIRVGGPVQTVQTATDRIAKLFGEAPDQVLGNEDAAISDDMLWESSNAFEWHNPKDHVLIKVPCQINDVVAIAEMASRNESALRIAMGGQVAYCSAPANKVNNLGRELTDASYRFLLVCGPKDEVKTFDRMAPELGSFASSIKRAVDPNNQFAIL